MTFRNAPNFSRNSAIQLGQDSLHLSESDYKLLERSRILCTRGIGDRLTKFEVIQATRSIPIISEWMQFLVDKIKVKRYERI